MDYNKLCSEIIKLHPKIRYAGIYSTKNGQVYDATQEGVTKFFDKEKTSNTFVHAYMRWKTRQHDKDIIGIPIYAVAKYEKLNRITIPASPWALLMITTQPELMPHEILDDVLNLIKKYSDDPNYTPKQVFMG